jgi:flagellar motor switch protein FliM
VGFNKRHINIERSLKLLHENKLKEYYGKSDALFFEDKESLKVYDLHNEGNTDEEILKIITKQMDTESTKKLLSKLRQPIHIDYIAKYILRIPEDEARVELNKLIEENLIEESIYAKDYYVIKNT